MTKGRLMISTDFPITEALAAGPFCRSSISPAFRLLALCGAFLSMLCIGSPAFSQTCTPVTSCPAGDNCGTIPNGCGGTLSCGICNAPQTCGGGGSANVCGPATCTISGTQYLPGTANPANACQFCTPGASTTSWSTEPNGAACACTNLCQQQATCSGGGTTSISGYVYDPANNLPVPNAIVYVPNAPVEPFTDGPSSGQQITGSPLVSTTTNVDGSFTLHNMPVGANIPLVVQAGLWRRQFTLPTVSSCATNTITIGPSGSASHLTLPSNHTQGDIPKIAIVTGSVSSVECVLTKMGVSTAEVTDPGGSGRINLYVGDSAGGAVVDGSTPAESTLFSSQANLNAYDVLMLASQGSMDIDATTANQLELADFANAGGRVYAETLAYPWIDGNSSFSNPVNWDPGQGAWGNYYGDSTYNADIDDTFSRGVGLANWLNQGSVYGGTLGVIPVGVIRDDFTSLSSGAQRWLYTANGNQNNGGPGANIPIQFTFDAPVGSTPQLGRVWFNDYLVDAQQSVNGYTGVTFPEECPSGPSGTMTVQEKLFEYSLFDLTSPVGSPVAAVSVTNSPSTFLLGDAADTVTINVSDTSATPLGTSLTLTAVLPTGLGAVSMAGQNTGTAWACNSSTLECTRTAALSNASNDPITLTVSVAANAPTGNSGIITATASGGGLASSATGGDAVTIAVPSNGCFISGVEYPAGIVNPSNSCQVCTPVTSTTSWSDQQDGTVCGSGNTCTSVCQAGVCTGSNLESCGIGDAGPPPAPWAVNTYLNSTAFTPQTPQTVAGLNLNAGGTALTVVETSAGGPLQQVDADLGAGATLRWPRYGNEAISVNQQQVSAGFEPKNVNSLVQTMTITSANIDPTDNKVHIRFAFAPVFYFGSVESAVDQPYYLIQVTDVTQGSVVYEDFATAGQNGIPWQTITISGDEFSYTDWQLVDSAMGAQSVNVGDQVQLRILAANNLLGGHYGRAWVNGLGTTINGISVEGSAPSMASPNSSLNYTLNYRNGSAAQEDQEDNVVLNFVTPTNSTFQAIDTSASCTTPAVGTAGTVSCSLGSLAAGASGSLTITVALSSAPSGTVVQRNYSISSTQETTLIGPPIFTSIGCSSDSMCAAGDWCDESVHACAPRLPNGTPLPNDPPHSGPTLNGTCTAAAGALVCNSGVCDTSNNTCGYKVGDGPCNSSNGGTVCDSGACSVSNVCEPAGGCEANGDCTSGMQCSASKACIPVLTVTAWPTASAINYGQTLAASTLTGGTASVSGSFSWTNPATAPPVGTSLQSVTFTPTDMTDYSTVTGTVSIMVNPLIAKLVVTTATDDAGDAANCTAQASAGTGTDEACSLRDALLFAANAGSGTISFDGTAFAASNSQATNTISLSNGTLNIPSNTTITGPTAGSGATLTNLVIVSGVSTYTVFAVNAGVTGASLNGLTIANGSSTAGVGGGIENNGSLTVTGTTISGSQSAGLGGGIYNNGTLTLSNSTVSGNQASGSGGGIYNQIEATLTLSDSTLSGNSAGELGGGIESDGKLTAINSTISANAATFAGGGIVFGAGSASLGNTIVSGNSSQEDADAVGGFTDAGGNKVGVSGIDLAPLGNYGGATQTMVPLPGSSAICSGIATSATAANLTKDQRGLPLPDPNCPANSIDSGAVQSNYALSFSTSPASTQATGVPLTPNPVVALTESGVVAAAATSAVVMSDSANLLGGTESAALSGGSATFSDLAINSATTGDTLTATLALSSTLNITANPASTITAQSPTASLSTTSLSFGSTTVGSWSQLRSVTLTNTGIAALSIAGIAVTGPNAAQFVFANTCGTSVAAGAQCTIHGHFQPTAGGLMTAAVTITDNAPGSPQSISLSGTGVEPPVSLSATSIAFGSTTLDQWSASQSVTMTNTGSAAVSISSIAVTGVNASQFVFADSCGASLAVGASCTLHGHFQPTAQGAMTAAVTITDSAAGSPQSIALSGTGVEPAAPITLSDSSLSFGSVNVGASSESQSVTVTNTGSANVSISSIAVAGANASSFVFANSCGTSLAVGANCTIHGHFEPTAGGAITAAVTITDSAAGSPQTILLSGTGVVPPVTLSAASLAYGPTTVGTSSYSQSVTMTNTGSATLSISSITVTGANASSFVFANNCGTSLAVGASCTIHGHVAPVVTGVLTAAVTIADSASGSPQTISLSGKGVSTTLPVLTLSSSSLSVSPGVQVTFTAALSGTNAGVPPTGLVAFYAGSLLLGQENVIAGSASLATSSLGAGSYTVSAVYSGDSNYLTATSNSITESVQLSCASGISGTSLSAFTGTQTSGWDLNGNAYYDSSTNTAVLTDATATVESGTGFYQDPIVADSFTLSFDFVFTTINGNADGMMFLLANGSATGVGSGYGGMGGLGLTGYGVELDIFNNGPCDGGNGNHAGIDVLSACGTNAGVPTPVATSANLFDSTLPNNGVGVLSDGTWRTATVQLSSGQLSVSITDSTGTPVAVGNLQNVSLPGFTSGTPYYFGFSAGTGSDGMASRAEIRNVSLTFPTAHCL